VDDDAVSRHVLVHTLTAAGLLPAPVPDGESALRWLAHSRPALILLDLIMPGADGYDVLRHIRSHASLADVPVVVLTALDSDDEIRRIFAEGADDYVHKPFRPTELVARLTGQLRLREYLDRLSRRERYAQEAVELTQVLASSPEIRPALSTVVRKLALLLQVDRCSIVLAGRLTNVAHVVVSSDDDKLRDLPLSLEKYPELTHVLSKAEALVIPDVQSHPLFAGHDAVSQIAFTTSALVPILHEKSPHGVIFIRSKRDAHIDDEELSLVRMVANATSIAFSNAQVLQSLREATEQSSTARAEAEERLRHFQRYVDFFESAADGMIVVDRLGVVLFTNPRTHQITGYVDSELRDKTLDALLFANEKTRIKGLLAGFGHGEFPIDVDLVAGTKDGREVVLSVSSSSVLREDNVILLSLRDVTAERKTAIALKQTKEFLERVIDSSADAIVSTDMSGRVLLFNRAASAMFDYEPQDVIGKLNVAALYPAFTPKAVLRQLVSRKRNDWGRLEDYRLQVLSRSNQLVPASLSAAFILEDGRPIGMVGVFTDLRERLRMEQSLAAAEEELREREKQAIVAELAGTTAHELNQPLTSIIGYSELLKRSLPSESALLHGANVIIGEAGRMAEIVRRIGRITRYDAKILDLDRSSPESSRKPYSP